MHITALFPKQTDFFAHFRDAAAVTADAAGLLTQLLAGLAPADEAALRLRELEHRGDVITHEVYTGLTRSFVPPLSYEDIRALARDLDEVINHIDEVGQRLVLYRLLPAPEAAQRFGSIIQAQAEILAEAVPLLRDGKHRVVVERHVAELHRLEHAADDELDLVLASLYDGVTEIPAFVQAKQWDELYGILEDTTDRAERAANTLQGIMEQRL
jgi:uncharacterized protein